eukprot:CAMPEP_0172926742 /NCGR_PEP_ID=MMETSP1075-20121228/216176_1 /TAXON_ID=2916 /ORGANISM="Ceratium fusus, Strain PA161109" /LENGTH=394 /DNA_ID=CAMNT_0013787877 /DNA_START=84 /DNA_END=1268 /DNA_ORIENTATION=+
MAWAMVSELLPELEECISRGAVPKSTGKWSYNYTIYTGLCGVALAHLRIGIHCRDVRGDAAAAAGFIQKAYRTGSACLAAEPRSGEVSFFCGTPGYLAITCVSAKLLGNEQAASSHLQALLGWTKAACQHQEDELLFGKAGYLYALLWVKQYCGAGAADFDTCLRETAESLVSTGRRRATRYPDWPLMWHCFNEPYVGAAHGIVGILAMLLHCHSLLSKESQQLVCNTLDRLVAERFVSGNLPIILGDECDEHVHWCHGAPGMPGLLAVAAEVLGDATGTLQRAAVQAADVVWERGVILKGNGLCHGLAGNGYAFLSLFRLTNDVAQLRRAAAFVELLRYVPLQQAMSRHPDPQRRVPGVPDSPRSLMEGSAGVVCFLLDASFPFASRFPAWEL